MQFYKEDIDVVFEKVKSSRRGLSNIEAGVRLEKFGENKLNTKTKVNPVKIFINQFKSFIVYILLIAIVLAFFLGEIVDAILILIILIANALIGFFQEFSAQKSLEALKRLNLVTAKVYRDGKLVEVNSEFLVVGDVIFLEAGDKVPADARIFEARGLRVDEANLTGESLPVTKKALKKLERNVSLPDQVNMLFTSTKVIEGSGKAVVVKTGMDTEIGKITTMIKESEDEMTPLQKRLDSFGKKVGVGVVFISLFVFLILIFTKEFSYDNLTMFAFVAISLAVAAVPTALPVVVTIALSIGVKRLLKRKALVRRLSSVETLGSCNVICTDKTGTLTQNEMTVVSVWDLMGEAKVEGIGYSLVGKVRGSVSEMIFKIGYFCNNASHYKRKGVWQILGDPTEGALLVSAKKFGGDFLKSLVKRIDEISFDSVRKMMSVLVQEEGDKSCVMYSKGAVNSILKSSTHALVEGKVVRLDDKIKEKILNVNRRYAKEALRVLAFAYKPVGKKQDFKEDKLIFVGLQAMIDPPRKDVVASVKKAIGAGIRVIMITGDYKETAIAIGRKVGIIGGAISGEELEEMSDEELREVLNSEINIFARVSPEDKLRIVKVLQNQGNVVAMTGDGVNDAPALKRANIGIAVGSGTEVAKEAADFVLLDDSFSNIVSAIEEGRGIYDNIQKSIMHLLSGNLGEVLLISLAVIFGWNLPLTAIMLLWINLITDGAPAVAFSIDPYSKKIMKRGPTKIDEGILPKAKLKLIIFLGFLSSMFALVLFNFFGGSTSNLGDKSLILAQTMVFNFIVLSELIIVLIIRKQYDIEFFSNFWLYVSIFFSIVMQIVLMYSPISDFFKIVPLDLAYYLYLLGGGFAFYLSYLIYNFFNKRLNVEIEL